MPNGFSKYLQSPSSPSDFWIDSSPYAVIRTAGKPGFTFLVALISSNRFISGIFRSVIKSSKGVGQFTEASITSKARATQSRNYLLAEAGKPCFKGINGFGVIINNQDFHSCSLVEPQNMKAVMIKCVYVLSSKTDKTIKCAAYKA